MLNDSKTKKIILSISLFILCLPLISCSDKKENSTQTAAEHKQATAQQTTNKPEVTNTKGQQKVITSWGDFDASPKPLLAALPDKGIYLYMHSKETGAVTLCVGDHEQKFDWRGGLSGPGFILPQMQVGDYDADGEDELAVSLFLGSGTGVSMEELHFVEISGDAKQKNFKDHVFNAEAYLKKAVGFKTFTNDGVLMARLTAGSKTYTVNLKDYQSKDFGKISDDLALTSIVGYDYDNGKIIERVGVGITGEASPMPQYIGYIYAEVDYSSGKDKLKDFRFEEEH